MSDEADVDKACVKRDCVAFLGLGLCRYSERGKEILHCVCAQCVEMRCRTVLEVLWQ